ncbi:MAG: methylenetetrahydrofolate reductase [NAD(P)H] [Croceicoccus sp.]|nr:methylenetetrahydrofolate reductase [NAD(P)H] [Croceicoccus sp.]MAL27570.1 methylenetetrahydrofolate reductase [NAD(P)H] [Croceicoccus sp.]|tara:strand:- start:33736 stop:34674 length:939 start_codon:yes stop_codon:yes gene_type:complete
MNDTVSTIGRPLFASLPGDIDVSFEFFPPKTEKSEQHLWETVLALAPLRPDFVSVTYGAGGSTRDRTHDIVARIIREVGLPTAAHLTCVEASKDEIREVAEAYWEAGVRHIVALRGDPPTMGQKFVPHPDGYASAADLVAGLKDIAPFDISVAAYPETHPEAASAESDLDNLKRKLDAGASRAITQFFFAPEKFLRFRDLAAAQGIDAPILPGILPVSNVAQTRKFAKACGAEIPKWMEELFEGLDNRPESRKLVAATIAAEMCRSLYAEGVRDFHFYTLNRAELSYAVCHLLGMRPKESARNASGLQETAA